MTLLALLVFILSFNWIFHILATWLPINLFHLVGQAFWLGVGMILLLFISWSFKD